jgi:hypothetical protein
MNSSMTTNISAPWAKISNLCKQYWKHWKVHGGQGRLWIFQLQKVHYKSKNFHLKLICKLNNKLISQ